MCSTGVLAWKTEENVGLYFGDDDCRRFLLMAFYSLKVLY